MLFTSHSVTLWRWLAGWGWLTPFASVSVRSICLRSIHFKYFLPFFFCLLHFALKGEFNVFRLRADCAMRTTNSSIRFDVSVLHFHVLAFGSLSGIHHRMSFTISFHRYSHVYFYLRKFVEKCREKNVQRKPTKTMTTMTEKAKKKLVRVY